jgi:PKD repeat protein
MLKNKQFKFSAIIIPITLLLVFTAENTYIGISSPEPSLTITTATNKKSYLLRQKVEINGNITLDGSPASDLLVSIQLNNPSDNPFAFQTIQVGNPTLPFSINITNLFITDTDNNPINTVKIGTSVMVGMTIYNYASTARAVFATFTVFDANMVPLATKTWSGTIDAQSSATPKYPVYIPKSACSGKALIVGNLYSKEPKTGGVLLSLPKTVYFCISRVQQGQFTYPTLPPPPPQTTLGIYTAQITLPPDPTAGTYGVYVLGQVNLTTTSTASTTFNVYNSAGYPPQASFAYWPVTPYLNMTVDFDASSSTPEGFGDVITQYEWNFGDGTSKITETDPYISRAYQITGTFNVTLKVTDNEGLWSTTTKPITILPEFGPTANFTWIPVTPVINETVTFDASGSTLGWCARTQRYSPIQNYTWNFGDGTGSFTTSSYIITHSYTQPNNYTVLLTVRDADGRVSTKTALIQVLNFTIKIYDFNGDGIIDMKDVRRAAKAFGAEPDDPNWDPVVDVNHDNIIDMKDIRAVAKNFGKDP